MVVRRDQELHAATKTRSRTECISAKPLRHAGWCKTCCVNRACYWNGQKIIATDVRFVNAQAEVYSQVIEELTEGCKRTHWMWFIFPQLAGMGHAQRYAIPPALSSSASPFNIEPHALRER